MTGEHIICCIGSSLLVKKAEFSLLRSRHCIKQKSLTMAEILLQSSMQNLHVDTTAPETEKGDSTKPNLSVAVDEPLSEVIIEASLVLFCSLF